MTLILTGFSLMTFINLTMGENYYIVPPSSHPSGKGHYKAGFQCYYGVKLLCNTGKAKKIYKIANPP